MSSENKKKILYVITKGNGGGAQRYVYDMATNIPKDSFESVVLCGEGDNLNKKLSEKNIRSISISSLGRDISFSKDLRVIKELIAIFKQEKPFVVHLNSSKAGLLGAIAGRLAKVPKIIFTGHGWAFNENRNIISKIIFIFAHWLTIMLAHRTIAVSEKTKKDISKMPFVDKKIKVIHNGIDTSETFLNKQNARDFIQKIKSTNCNFWIGSIVELHKNKGQDYLIKGFAKITVDFPNTCLFIIGEGEERNNLTTLIENLKLKNRVFLLGRIENAWKYLNAFDIFTLTSRTEALPYTILEAGLAEKAVIASRVGGIPEIIEDRFSGILVPKENDERIADAMAIYLRDEGARNKHAQNLKNTIIENFSINKMVRETIAEY